MATHKEIYDYLRSVLPNCKPASGQKQLVTICPNPACNDKSGHLYIGPFNNTNDPIMYNCFKCGLKGMVSKKFLEMFNIYDDTFLKELQEFNSNIPAYTNNSITKKGFVQYPLVNDYITACDLSAYKLSYINSRLGTSLTYQDIVQNKIVLNLYDVIQRNWIDVLTRDPRIVDELNENFIGFLATDNNYLNMRKCTDKQVNPTIDKRYINYYIRKVELSCKYYTIPTDIDLTSPEPITVHLAEGPFDILGIFYNVMNRYTYRSIYLAIGGKGYSSAIEYLISGLGLSNLILHIYPDLDIPDAAMYDIADWLAPFDNDIYIHRNQYKDPETLQQEKDFGVPKNRIKMSTVQLHKRKNGYYGLG